VVRFPDRTPKPVLLEDRNHVVVIANCCQVDNQRLMPVHSKRCRSKEGALHAMGCGITYHTPRRTACLGLLLFVVADVIFEELLKLFRPRQLTKDIDLMGIEAITVMHANWSPHFRGGDYFPLHKVSTLMAYNTGVSDRTWLLDDAEEGTRLDKWLAGAE